MKLKIHAAWSELSGNPEDLEKVNNHYSFTNKSIQSQLKRFKDTLRWKEINLIKENDGDLPDWFNDWKKDKLKELKDKLKVFACKKIEDEPNKILIPTGLVPSLVEGDFFKGSTYEDIRDFDISKRILEGELPDKLRKPQIEALNVINLKKPDYKEGIGLFKMATAVGKTTLAQEIIRKYAVPSIFLVPSRPILIQTVKRFEDAFGRRNVAQFGAGKKKIGYVTVATYQSVNKADPELFKDIRLMMADEVHKVGADTFYEAATNHLKNCVYRYSLTAYNERADGGTVLVEAASGPIIYDYPASEGIKDGYLAKPTFMIYDILNTKGKWAKYKMKGKKRVFDKWMTSTKYNGKDHLAAYRHWYVGNDLLNNAIVEIIKSFKKDGKSILILVDEIAHGQILHGMIEDSEFAVGGQDNTGILRDFNKRELKVLIGTSTLGEGVDTIPVDILINLQGGASKSSTLQVNGRALRNEGGEKTTTLIIDFNFPSSKMLSRHSQIREKIHKSLGETHHAVLI